MPRITIYPANGNPVIAAVLVALYEFKFQKRIDPSAIPGDEFSFDEISLSFSTEEVANRCLNEIRRYGSSNSGKDPKTSIIHPAYETVENSIKAFYYAVNAYKDDLVSVNRLILGFASEEEMNGLIEDIGYYIKARFGSESLRFETE